MGSGRYGLHQANKIAPRVFVVVDVGPDRKSKRTRLIQNAFRIVVLRKFRVLEAPLDVRNGGETPEFAPLLGGKHCPTDVASDGLSAATVAHLQVMLDNPCRSPRVSACELKQT